MESEKSLRELQTYLMNWGTEDEEITLILGNVRRMLGEERRRTVDEAITVTLNNSKPSNDQMNTVRALRNLVNDTTT